MYTKQTGCHHITIHMWAKLCRKRFSFEESISILNHNISDKFCATIWAKLFQ